MNGGDKYGENRRQIWGTYNFRNELLHKRPRATEASVRDLLV